MQTTFANLRPAVLSTDLVESLDEYLRFRHVVRNIYAFQFDPERIAELVSSLRPVFAQIRDELLAFTSFLEAVGGDGASAED